MGRVKGVWRVLVGALLVTATACGKQDSPTNTVVPSTTSSGSHQKIAYHVVENGRGIIYLVDVETKAEIRLTDLKEGVGPYFSFSPDGQRLVYVAASGSRAADIYVANFDGTDKKQRSRNRTCVGTQWAENCFCVPS